MQRIKPVTAVVIDDITLDRWQERLGNIDRFTIMYIHTGRGKFYLNGNRFPYLPGCLIMLQPADDYDFDIKETSRFTTIDCTTSYLLNTAAKQQVSHKAITRHFTGKPPEKIITCNDQDKALLAALFEVIATVTSYNKGNQTILSLQFISILEVIARNRQAKQALEQRTLLTGTGKLEGLIAYIQKNVHKPKLLRVRNLSHVFQTKASYIGVYFRRNMNMTLNAYINEYKVIQMSNRIRDTDASLKQIASEFGLTDESHLNKVFKKYSGIGPGAFRKQLPLRDTSA